MGVDMADDEDRVEVTEPAHVQQARAELAEAQRLGNDDSARAATKRLAASGVDVRREAATARKAAAEKSAKSETPARTPEPAGRRTPTEVKKRATT
jgi:hypothetical protein